MVKETEQIINKSDADGLQKHTEYKNAHVFSFC